MVRACQHVCHRAPRQRARVTHFELRVLLQGLVALGPQRDRIASVTSHQLCASKTPESRRNSIFPARRDSGVYLAAPSASRESRTAAGGRRFAPRRWHRTRRPSSRPRGPGCDRAAPGEIEREGRALASRAGGGATRARCFLALTSMRDSAALARASKSCARPRERVTTSGRRANPSFAPFWLVGLGFATGQSSTQTT